MPATQYLHADEVRRRRSEERARRRLRRRRPVKWAVLVGLPALLLFLALTLDVRYANVPQAGAVLNPQPGNPLPAYDLWGQDITAGEFARLQQTAEGRRLLSPENGAIRIDKSLIGDGRQAFYGQTFGNEIFLTDVMGMLSGPVTLTSFATALIDLGGRGTTNLRVPLQKSATIGGVAFRKGQLIDTGIDVPKGSFAPIGLAVRYRRGRVFAGITCAVCHSTVDSKTGHVIDGAPNADFNPGLLMALASNTAAYFPHADGKRQQMVPRDPSSTVTLSDSRQAPMPAAKAFEDAVDAAIVRWTPGNFDSMVDLVPDPTQMTISWTLGHHPYGTSGNFAAGPFKGLSAQNNNVHALNADSLVQADQAPLLFGMDKEMYLALILRRAASPGFRWKEGSSVKPSVFFASVDPTPGTPGMNEIVAPPTFPHAIIVSPDGTYTSSPGKTFWHENNAMSAWQNTLVPPPPPTSITAAQYRRGHSVFERAGCVSCHSGPKGSNNRVYPALLIATDPARALALRKTERALSPPVVFPFDTPVPLPKDAKTIPVPTDRLDMAQVRMAWGQTGTPGGYKVPVLVGLAWSAPYLHEGGVAVGPNAQTQLGLSQTLLKQIAPDPTNSLRALVDRILRAKVVAANRANPTLVYLHNSGIGHNYWADAKAGFTPQEQTALVQYLLHFGEPEPK